MPTPVRIARNVQRQGRKTRLTSCTKVITIPKVTMIITGTTVITTTLTETAAWEQSSVDSLRPIRTMLRIRSIRL